MYVCMYVCMYVYIYIYIYNRPAAQEQSRELPGDARGAPGALAQYVSVSSITIVIIILLLLLWLLISYYH